MTRFVAYIVHPDPIVGERVELIDMKGRVLKDKADVMRWLGREAPKRPDLAGRRIDVVDADEPLRSH
jgi:hypothetical protein